MNILLVEPDYKNKYPPMGLMKISTYHKRRGDNVFFHKGKLSKEAFIALQVDRIYITSLFTFYFDKTINTIEHYKQLIDHEKIFVGGIMVSLLHKKVLEATGINNLLIGLLKSSSVLNLQDDICIDELPLDYSILDEIEYEYPSGDNYISYATRGCPNKCKFCAVPTLEPNYNIIENIAEQIIQVNQNYSKKRNLLLLDNNVFNLSCEELNKLVEKLINIGFRKTPSYIKDNDFELFIKKSSNPRTHPRIEQKAVNFLLSLQYKIKNISVKIDYVNLLLNVLYSNDVKSSLLDRSEEIRYFTKKYSHPTKVKRYIDFNQGLEAARMTEEKIAILSKLPLKPVRIAFDHYTPSATDSYIKAVKTAHKYEFNEFSNYMLYNYDDKPEDLWLRLKVNIDLSKELGIHMFSFPMKYVPITQTDRKYIGEHWNKHFLQSIPAILLVTKGIVASGESFFFRAFGSSISEFLKILTMPRDFITYRQYYDDAGLTQKWSTLYNKLNGFEKTNLIDILSGEKAPEDNRQLSEILKFYESGYRYTSLNKTKSIIL